MTNTNNTFIPIVIIETLMYMYIYTHLCYVVYGTWHWGYSVNVNKVIAIAEGGHQGYLLELTTTINVRPYFVTNVQ